MAPERYAGLAGVRTLLGVEDGVGYRALLPADPAPPEPSERSEGSEPAVRPLALHPRDGEPPADEPRRRAVGDAAGGRGGLSARDSGLLVTAVALANWHAAHPHCPRCGAPTEVINAGWVRRCPPTAASTSPATTRRSSCSCSTRRPGAAGPAGGLAGRLVLDAGRVRGGRGSRPRWPWSARWPRRPVCGSTRPDGLPGQPALAVPVLADARLPRERGGGLAAGAADGEEISRGAVVHQDGARRGLRGGEGAASRRGVDRPAPRRALVRRPAARGWSRP